VKELTYGVGLTFQTLTGVKPDVAAPQIVDDPHIAGDVSGIISINQDKSDSMLILAFPKATILPLLSTMYRKNFTDIDASVRSGVGELTNTIYGVLKANLNRDGFTLKTALPSVILGAQHIVTNTADGKGIVLQFSLPAGPFFVVLTVQAKVQKAAA
jgi:CheY-specific phosphatase CheX